jgi:cysteine desulfurase
VTAFAYLDHNATSPARPCVGEAMAEALSLGGNPSSVHRFGRLARRAVDRAREQIAQVVKAQTDQIVFTSGGTEANALALRGCGRRRVLVSAIEHPSAGDAVPGCLAVPVGTDGRADMDRLGTLLADSDEPAIVSAMLANNETGVIQPLADIVALARRHGALVHCDAVQALGRIEVDFAGLGVDLMTISAHKIGGPMGVGALVVGRRAAVMPELRGGGQELGRRSGTENVPGIVGFGVAAEAAVADLARSHEWRLWRDRLERHVRELAPEATIYGDKAPRLSNTSCIGLAGVAAETQVMALDLAGVAVSAGAACSSGKVRPSHVLVAMGFGEVAAREAIRVSLGWNSRAEDVDRFLQAWSDMRSQVRSRRSKAAAEERTTGAAPAA